MKRKMGKLGLAVIATVCLVFGCLGVTWADTDSANDAFVVSDILVEDAEADGNAGSGEEAAAGEDEANADAEPDANADNADTAAASNSSDTNGTPSSKIAVASTGVASGTCGDNLTWTIDENCTLTISGTGDMTTCSSSSNYPWYSYCTQIKSVVVEQGVTSISQYAFYSTQSAAYSALESVKIAGSVKTIGLYAFGCVNSSAGNSSKLTSLTLEEGIGEIGASAFRYCKALTSATIPDSVTTIGNFAFRYCTGMTKLVVGGGVTSMGSYAFGNCTALYSLTLEGGITEIGSNAFYGCTALTSATIPDSVTTVGSCAFYQDTQLSSATLGSNVATIGESAFYGCTGLTKVDFAENSSLTSIGKSAFCECSSLASIALPESLETLGEYVFDSCSALKGIDLPENIKEIPFHAFSGCTNLEKVTAKGTISSIGAYAFNNDSALETIFDLGSVTEMSVSSNKSYAFGTCSSLAGEIDLSSLDAIPAYAFYKCSSITGATFGNDLTSIGDYAFYKCNNISKLDFPGTLTSIGKYAFWNCWLQGNNTTTTVKSGAAVTDVVANTTSTLKDDTSYSGYTLVIPDSVTSIGSNAFAYSFVCVFDIGSGLTNVDATAFQTYKVNAVIFDNMQDDVTVTNSSSLGKNKDEDSTNTLDLVYRQGSIGDVGDTISDAEGAMTLQQAVDAVAAGTYTENGTTTTTITISKNIKLSSTLRIPAAFNGTITTAKDSSFIIIADSSKGLNGLIEVEEGANVTFGGDVALNGKNNSGSVIYTEGSVTLVDNATVTGSNISATSSGTGVIDVVGSKATFTMDGGTVENNTIGGPYSGVIRASKGGRIVINDGVIQNNKANDLTWSSGALTSSGIMLYGDSSAQMNGGTIQNNTSFRGAAVYLYSIDSNARAQFELNGGTITGNTSPHSTDAAGAVFVNGNASFTMNGGTISGNYGYSGGGVAVADYYQTDNCDASFTMNGGTISGNNAHAGGGIYSYSNGVVLNAGYITGNTAYLGGGVYSEGNSTYFTTVQMYNVLVSDNGAEQGGGMWLCPTGTANIYVTDGGALTGNTAEGAGDDIVFAAGDDTSLTLADRILGGGAVDYYQDGSVYLLGADFYTSVGNAARYNSDSYKLDTDAAITSNTAGISVVGGSALELAKAQAKLYITDNTATYGGGIGSNGGVTIGEKETTSLTVTKTWNHKDNPESNQPDSIKLQLIRTCDGVDYVIETVTVKADKNGTWSHTFEDLPTDGNYSVKEVTPDYYTAKVSDATGSAENGYEVIIANTYHEAALAVKKAVTGDDGDKTAEFHFTVTLGTALSGTYGDMVFENGIATFTLKDGESLTATGLPAGITYEVVETEADADGYTTKAENATGTLAEDKTAVATFTNNKDADEPTPPGTPDDGDDTPDDDGGATDEPDGGGTTDTPKTGDSAQVGILIAIAIAIASFTIAGFCRRRRRPKGLHVK